MEIFIVLAGLLFIGYKLLEEAQITRAFLIMNSPIIAGLVLGLIINSIHKGSIIAAIVIWCGVIINLVVLVVNAVPITNKQKKLLAEKTQRGKEEARTIMRKAGYKIPDEYVDRLCNQGALLNNIGGKASYTARECYEWLCDDVALHCAPQTIRGFADEFGVPIQELPKQKGAKPRESDIHLYNILLTRYLRDRGLENRLSPQCGSEEYERTINDVINLYATSR